jgi:hypothetical protein
MEILLPTNQQLLLHPAGTLWENKELPFILPQQLGL